MTNKNIEEPPKPSEEFLARWYSTLGGQDDIAITLGLQPRFGDPTEVRLVMPLTPAISQPGGLFSAPALFGLADISGSTLAQYHAPADTFPLAVHASVHIVANTAAGSATSVSRLVKAGRRLIVTSTDVFDDTGRLLTKVDATFVPSNADRPRLPRRQLT